MKFSQLERTAITGEINSLLDKKVIQLTEPHGGFVSNIFTVPKTSGKVRLILNLKSLNTFLEYEHFKMEDIRCIKDLLSRNEFICKLDLKDAYLTVPVHPSHWRFLRFHWQGKVYEYTALPFGLATAPRLFTKLLKPVLANLRTAGVRLIGYLDDFLIIGKTKPEAEGAYMKMKSLLESLGFIVNAEKSLQIATQKIEFLGYIIDSVRMDISLPVQKMRDIRSECRHLLRDKVTTVRKLARLVGMLVATNLAVPPAPLHYRALQALKIDALHRHHSYESVVILNHQSTLDLKWWIDHLTRQNGSPIVQSPPTMIIESDASNSGWGACSNNLATGGQWSASETLLHINAKELLAAFLALQTFARDKTDTHIRLKIDNITAVYFINRKGGTHSKILMDITSQMWGWCMERKIYISAEHLPGKLHTVADQESRARPDSSEWKLNPSVFKQLMTRLGPCQIDLFASRLTTQLPEYFSWKPDPNSVATNALDQNWAETRCYAFPPFALIGRCLAKVNREKVPELVLIAPVWPTQPWFPLMTSMLIRQPILLPNGPMLLRSPRNETHPLILQGSLNLAAWVVSGLHYRVKEFQTEHQSLSLRLGDQIQRQLTPLTGGDGQVGANRMDTINFLPL